MGRILSSQPGQAVQIPLPISPAAITFGHDDYMPDLYSDKWITCNDDDIVIRWYYLWGNKRIPYSAIRSAKRVDIDLLHGKGRIWGTANPGYWASLDPGRPTKSAALILDVGGAVKPFITPDDVPAVAEIIKERAGLGSIPDAGSGPFI
jgi:hypothetical protein